MKSQNEKLSKANAELLKKIEILEAAQKGKPFPARLYKNAFTFGSVAIDLYAPGKAQSKNSLAEAAKAPPKPSVEEVKAPAAKKQQPAPAVVVPVKVIPVKAVQSLKAENVSQFKNCILSSSGNIYEDSALNIAMIKTIDNATKAATFKLNFFNKSADQILSITDFVPVSYNKLGISGSIIFC